MDTYKRKEKGKRNQEFLKRRILGITSGVNFIKTTESQTTTPFKIHILTNNSENGNYWFYCQVEPIRKTNLQKDRKLQKNQTKCEKKLFKNDIE